MQAEDTEDVITAVQMARERGLQVTVCSGGHGWSASHLRDEVLLIDVSRLADITLDAGGERAWAGPGAKGWHLNRQLRERGRMFPAGHHRSVGLGGYLLNGGWGWNARQFGVGCANVSAIDLIDAQGRLIHADESQNSDYLWAARGAGAGFFGVVETFSTASAPLAASSSTRSVCVPPTSTPNRYLPLIAWTLFPQFARATRHNPQMKPGSWLILVGFSIVAAAIRANAESGGRYAAITCLRCCPRLRAHGHRHGTGAGRLSDACRKDRDPGASGLYNRHCGTAYR